MARVRDKSGLSVLDQAEPKTPTTWGVPARRAGHRFVSAPKIRFRFAERRASLQQAGKNSPGQFEGCILERQLGLRLFCDYLLRHLFDGSGRGFTRLNAP